MKQFLIGLILALVESPPPLFAHSKMLEGEKRVDVSTHTDHIRLIDEQGHKIDGKFFKDKHSILFFGFTQCSDICPIGMKALEKALIEEPPRIPFQVIFVSIDSKRDKPEKLRKFLSRYKGPFKGVTGEWSEIYKFYSLFVHGDAALVTERLNHSRLLYVIGPDGKLDGHTDSEASTGEIRRRLTSLTQTENP